MSNSSNAQVKTLSNVGYLTPLTGYTAYYMLHVLIQILGKQIWKVGTGALAKLFEYRAQSPVYIPNIPVSV